MKLRPPPAPMSPPAPCDIVLRPAAEAKVWTAAGSPHETMAVPGVVLAPGDVLVAVELATASPADVRVATGAASPPAPLVLGHEGVGRVVAVGEGGTRGASGQAVLLGDRVVWAASIGCGDCIACRRGLPAGCRDARRYGQERIGAHWELSGTFATHVHVRSGTPLVPVGERMPARVAAPAAGAAATAWAALRRAERVVGLDGALVLVTGAGVVGLSATSMAADRGARVIVSEPQKKRRALALRFGAAAAIDPCDAGAIRRAIDALGGEDIRFALEASGTVPATETAIAAVGVGGVVVLTADAAPPHAVPLDSERLVRDLVTVTGVPGGGGRDLVEAIAYLRASWGSRPFEDLVDPVLPLADVDDALRLAAAGTSPRIGIDPRR